MNSFRALVEEEKKQARAANGDFNSMHEIYGVLAEELFEFFQQMVLKPSQRDTDNILKELVQISTVAEMAAEDLYLVEKAKFNEKELNLYKEKYDEFVAKVQHFLENTAVLKARPLQKKENNDTNLLTLHTTLEAFQPLTESEECQNISL